MVNRHGVIFLLFFLSGFCSLLYQVVWIRMAYASFGVITPVLSVVISVFMLGLSLGSWFGGKWVTPVSKRLHVSSLVLYAIIELVIGTSAFIVPRLFSFGEDFLLSMGDMDSFDYLLSSGLLLGCSILPWCILMGCTFPFMMAFMREVEAENTASFSFLYFANVVGAMCGSLLTAFVLIELIGFRQTLWSAAVVNLCIAIVSLLLSRSYSSIKSESNFSDEVSLQREVILSRGEGFFICLLLFITGFTSMAMEVVWIRAFTPMLKTRTYSFATLLAVYLFGTWLGSYIYRRALTYKKPLATEKLIAALSVFAFLPIILPDPRLDIGIVTVLLSIFPFCVALGYLTPKLIDTYSSGEPFGAGKAYALNIIGCIIGPLFASYFLLPLFGVKVSLITLALPFLILIIFLLQKEMFKQDWSIILSSLAVACLLQAVFINVSYEEVYADYPDSEIRRDHTATVVSVEKGMNKRLLVNGIGITRLTPITKIMAHLPLSFLPKKPESSLVICFGMGTTYRSLLTWDIKATAVELVPSVKDAFGYYFDDAGEILKNPLGKIVIDDGRRFLKRIDDKYDVITLDPPPPIETAGSSLLYSVEFYDVVKQRLKPGGILQQWFPGGEYKIFQAVCRAVQTSFPHVRVFESAEGWGFHFLCSMGPIEKPTVGEFIDRMPLHAREDMLEWFPNGNLESLVTVILQKEVPLENFLHPDPAIIVTDDKPFNEYYAIRRLLSGEMLHFFY